MFPFQPKPESSLTFAEMFFEHYSRILAWALQLTRGDRFEAEDLVQELYIRFVRLGAAPEQIESIENYLFSVLRNLHYSRVRSARTSALDDLSIVDYDSANWGMRSVDRNGLLFIRADLHRICDYLCERNKSSRSASIFMLRYFLGYFPNEVVKVVQSTRGAVNQAIMTVRREARLELRRAGSSLRQKAAGRESKERSSNETEDPQSLFSSLRSKIFKSCPGECLGLPLLESKYGQVKGSFTAEELAHLVSCRTCLDQANQILGLPLLEERSPDEAIGRDTPPGPGSSGGQTPTLLPRRPKRKKEDVEKYRKQLQRRLDETNQHHPRRLLIAVDGDVRGSQRVTALLSELQVDLSRIEKPTYIEVLSEQGVCLGFLLVHAPSLDGDLYQTQNILLSDDRSLDIVVSFAAETPTIQVIYRDPLIGADGDAEEEDAQDQALAFAPPTFTSIGEKLVINSPRRLWRHIAWFSPLDMNGLLASAVLFGLCSIICFLLWTRSGPRISAKTLLSRAEQSDASTLKPAHPGSANLGVIYQKVRIREQGASIDRAIYRDPEGKRRPKRQRLNADAEHLKNKLDLAGVSWEEPLSAANYRQWHDQQPVKRDIVTESGKGLITLTTSTEANSPILKESLTVRESDFHPVERTIELRSEGTVEIAELNYDVMPWGAVNQDWFEPPPGQSAIRPTHPSLATPVQTVLSELELDEAELGARVALNHFNADTGEQIHVTRAATGIQAKGVVDTEQRKLQLVTRLLQVPHVHPSLLSVEEISSHPQTSSPSGQPVQVYSVEAQPSPLEQYMRENKLPLNDLAAISHGLLDGCFKIQQAQGHLSELQQHFKEASQLPDDLRSQLAGLSLNYVQTIQAGLDADKRALHELGFDTAEQSQYSADSRRPDGNANEDTDEEIGHYQDLCRELISGGAGPSRPALAIANDLIRMGASIRSSVAEMQRSPSTAHN